MIDLSKVYKACPELIEDMTDENPLVVYSIIRKSLGMSVGKIASQCQHAIQYFIDKYFQYVDDFHLGNSEFNSRFLKWKDSSTHTKITLEASDNEWEKLKLEYDPIIVVDAGKTEIPAGSETVMILWPMFRSERSKLLKRLQNLK